MEKVIPEFPNYIVCDDGGVYNSTTGRPLVWSPTMNGDPTVGMMKDGIQYRRSVKVLVAQAFVDGWTDIFDTPIQMDGDKYNLQADNICWRPRWFAWKYSRQFAIEPPGWFYAGPIFDVINSIKYPTIFEAAIATGSLCEDIHYSILNETHVFPNGERYTYL